jgi:hypothetical protein
VAVSVQAPTPLAQERAARAADLPTVQSRAFRTGRNLILLTLVVLVVTRLFTEILAILPPALNYLDVPLLGALALYALVVLPPGRPAGFRPAFVPALMAFVTICALSVVTNLSRVEPAPVLVFVYGFAGPLLAYTVAYRMWPVGQAFAMSRTIVALGLLQFLVVVVIDLPRFAASSNPDVMSGTFGENAYQMVIFLLVVGALVTGIATFERGSRVAKIAPLILLATFVVIFLAQYRALIVTTALSVALTGVMITRGRSRGIIPAALILISLAVGFSIVVSNLPFLRFDRAVQALREDPASLAAGKLGGARDLGNLFAETPRFLITGTGPGTYSSRAWRTFAALGFTSEDPTAATGYRTDVSDRYVRPRLEARDYILGSKVLATPFSSYLALLAEVGLGGFLVIMVVYLTALSGTMRRARVAMRTAAPGDPLPALLLATAIWLFVLLQAAVLDNWLEVARITTPMWILVAVTTKEFQARRVLRSAEGAERRTRPPGSGQRPPVH